MLLRPGAAIIEHMFAAQDTLFGGGEVHPDPAFTTLARRRLDDTAWVDVAPGWLAGDATLLEILRDGVEWEQPEVQMYDRKVLTPRLVGRPDPALHPAIGEMSRLLSGRYGVQLDRVSAGYYRDGADSVAWHGDRIARERDTATVATVSLGGPRRFRLRPKGGGASLTFALGHGDLVVMGGSTQRTWDHCVPKAASAPPRIALMFRHAYD